MGRNLFRDPGTWNFAFATIKNFHIVPGHENVRLQLRGEYFNIFNHANKNNPNGDVSSGGFGSVTSSGQPRVIQLGVHFVF